MKNKLCNGSITVEMSFLMPMILFLILSCILAVFYYHDKNIISGAAYETAVVGSTKAREREGVTAEELQELFEQRLQGKCILFPGVRAKIGVGEKEIKVEVRASWNRIQMATVKYASVTEPETYIRDIRRWKNKNGTKNHD